MESHVTDNPEESRYEIFDGGERAGFVEYHRFRDEIAEQCSGLVDQLLRRAREGRTFPSE
ncbi:hypothetical protein ACFUCT_33225 [Streptomyces parvus]|uniref:hypothetical protein n=1 Tax=Streptomyces parvus TaxID=66428 RepID=UPI003634A3F1